MRLRYFALSLAGFVLAACGQSNEASQQPEAPAAPQAMMEQVLAMAPEQQPVFAFQQLAAYQSAHPDSQPTCSAVRASEARGIIPPDAAPDSIYAAYIGAAVYSVQCGALVSRTRFDPSEHWLVVFAPGAAEAAIVNCADARGLDQCPRAIPKATATP
jgi:hypothetical protein